MSTMVLELSLIPIIKSPPSLFANEVKIAGILLFTDESKLSLNSIV